MTADGLSPKTVKNVGAILHKAFSVALKQGLSWGQVDFEAKRITVSQQLQKEKKKDAKYYIAPTTKSGKVRQIAPPDIAFKYLRAATVAIASGADVKSVQDLLGHATASFTLNVYAHTSDKMKRDTAERMQSYYDNLQKTGQK